MTDQTVVQEPVVITDTSANTNPVTPETNQAPTVTTPEVIVPTTTPDPVVPPATSTTDKVVTAEPEVVVEPDMSWKEELKKQVGDDAKLLKIIDKFKSPKDILTSNAELTKKLSSTRALPELPENATEEQIKEFREAAGIPDQATGYELELEIPESYKEGLDTYLKIAHQNNRPLTEVKKAVADYLKVEEARSQVIRDQIAAANIASEKEMKDSWGQNYDTNKAVNNAFFEKIFGEDAELIKNAYLPDGTKVGENAKVLTKLLDVSKNTIGAATIISNNIVKDVTTIQDRLKSLDNMALDGSSPYWGANHDKFKSEHDQLRANLADVKKNRR